jgi:hypothetical protein
MAGKLRIPRMRGAVTGMLLVLLGAWGALGPLIGPYFRFAYSPDSAWTYTTGRMFLEILPGIAAFIGGVLLLASRLRPVAVLGGWIGAASGAWFAIGGAVSPLWIRGSGPLQGAPLGGTGARALEQIGFFSGLGVVVVLVAAVAIGRLTVVAAADVGTAASGGSTASARATTAAQTGVPGSRVPVGAAVLRRVVPGASRATANSAGFRDSAEPAKITS